MNEFGKKGRVPLHERLAKGVFASGSGSEHVVPNCAVAPRDNAPPMEISQAPRPNKREFVSTFLNRSLDPRKKNTV